MDSTAPGRPGGGGAFRYLLFCLRLVWLLPLTAGAALFALTLLASLFRGAWLRPVSLLLQAGLAWPLFLAIRRSWRGAGRTLRGEAEASAGELLRQFLWIFLFLVIPLMIIVPKIIDLQNYVLEGETKGRLSSVRLALDEKFRSSGKYPASAAELAAALEGGAFPRLWTAKGADSGHAPTGDVFEYPDGRARDSGGWAFVPAPEGGAPGVFIDCTHKDPRGRPWSSY